MARSIDRRSASLRYSNVPVGISQTPRLDGLTLFNTSPCLNPEAHPPAFGNFSRLHRLRGSFIIPASRQPSRPARAAAGGQALTGLRGAARYAELDSALNS